MPSLLAVRLRKRLVSRSAGTFDLDADFTVPAGITILFGESGAGKTTVLALIAGLLRPDGGRIALEEKILFDSERGVEMPAARRSVGYVFQDLALFPHLNVQQNVAYGLGKLNRAMRSRRVQSALESFRIAHLAKRSPAEISGGEAQRVALARALVTEPCVLLLDEPLAALDLVTKSKIIEDLRAWYSARQVPILYVTHSHQEVFALGERVMLLKNGRVLAQGTPYEVLETPWEESVAQLAGFENIFDARVVTLHEKEGTMSCLVETPSPAGAAGARAFELELPLGRTQPGSRVRVAIRAGDILISTVLPQNVSARNILPGRVQRLEHNGVTVSAWIDCGIEMEAKLTPGACESLDLKPGRQVWLMIKTYSCHLVLN